MVSISGFVFGSWSVVLQIGDCRFQITDYSLLVAYYSSLAPHSFVLCISYLALPFAAPIDLLAYNCNQTFFYKT